MRLFTPLLVLASLSMLPAQPPPGGRPGGGNRPPPKNLQLLQPSDIRTAMPAFKAALGVECTFCHNMADFSSDENPHKAIARKMIVMEREINAKFPDGKMHVTCYTCHRGAEEPATAPAATATPPAAK